MVYIRLINPVLSMGFGVMDTNTPQLMGPVVLFSIMVITLELMVVGERSNTTSSNEMMVLAKGF